MYLLVVGVVLWWVFLFVCFLNISCAVDCQHYRVMEVWQTGFGMESRWKEKKLLILFIKPIYKIYVICPLSANGIAVDEFLFRKAEILLYQEVNTQNDTRGLAVQVIIFDVLSLVLLVLLSK